MAILATPTAGAPTFADTENVNDVYGMIEKVGRQVISAAKARNPMDVFDKGFLEYGSTIEDVVIKAAVSRGYSKAASSAITPTAPNKVVRYFNDWTSRDYYTSVYDADVRAVIAGAQNIGDISAAQVASLTEGETGEDYDDYKALLAKLVATDNGFLRESQIVDAPDTIENALLVIRNIVSAMSFKNDTYSGIEGLETRTSIDDLYILMPYELYNAIDIRVLANLFNMEKADLMARIVQIDTEDGYVFVTDRDSLGMVTRDRQFDSQRNIPARCQDYRLGVTKMWYYNPLHKLAAIPCGDLI